MTETEVLVVGAGPVGLSLAIELGLRGIACLVVERETRVGLSPRAKTTNVRTREHLRRWGLAEALRQASPIPRDYPFDVVFATRMSGPALARFENVSNGGLERSEFYSEAAQWVPQYTLEKVLRDHAAGLREVSLAFDTALENLSQDADGVDAIVAGPNGRGLVRARYLVGADGARSTVRDEIGARMLGDPTSGISNFSVIFRAPSLARRHLHGRAVMYWMVNPDVSGLLGPMDAHGLWFFMATKLAGGIDPQTVDAAGMIRRSTGLLDLELELVREDPWIARRLIANRYRHGRVFLAGDACHLHPPFGGFGMNMGVGDAVDLGWKLAATLRGWGGPLLMESYEQERRPVHERTMDEAVVNYATVGNQLVRSGIETPGPDGDAIRLAVTEDILASKMREFRTLGLVLGAHYAGSPIVVPDGSRPPPDHVMHYIPSASPGCLAPHLWLGGGESLYDRFGPCFTLLVTAGEPEAAAGFVEEAARLEVPLTVLAPRDSRLAGLYGAGMALIRPDQHVAWRGDRVSKPADVLRCVTGHAIAPHASCQLLAGAAS